MDQVAEPAGARTWLWAMRVAALSGLLLHAAPLFFVMGWGGSIGSLLAFLPAVTLAAGYGVVLWLLRSSQQPSRLRLGHVLGRLVALIFLLSAVVIVRAPIESTLGIALYLLVPPTLLLVAGLGLARCLPARPHDWAVALAVTVPLVLGVYLAMPPFRHGPNYTSFAISHLRSIVSAEQAYSSANFGPFGSLECLAVPHKCVPGYPADAPIFLSSTDDAEERTRHRFVFHPGPEASVSDPLGQRYSGFRSFAVTAVPLKADRPSFCTDGSGVILSRSDGQLPEVEEGVCVEGPGTTVRY